MTVPAENQAEDGNPALCKNGNRCVDTVDGHARETTNPLCPKCVHRSSQRTHEFPEQYLRLHAMLGDHHAGIDVNIKHQKPGGTVNLNVHVDTLMGDIQTALGTAAEVLADHLQMRDKNQQPLTPTEGIPAEQVVTCTRIVAPRIQVLQNLTDIDVMSWNKAGTLYWVGTIAGWQLVKRLDHLSSLAYYTLGQTRARTQRDLPCTRCSAKTVGRWAGSETFDCTTCGSRFPEDDIRRQDRILVELAKRGILTKEGR